MKSNYVRTFILNDLHYIQYVCRLQNISIIIWCLVWSIWPLPTHIQAKTFRHPLLYNPEEIGSLGMDLFLLKSKNYPKKCNKKTFEWILNLQLKQKTRQSHKRWQVQIVYIKNGSLILNIEFLIRLIYYDK